MVLYDLVLSRMEITKNDDYYKKCNSYVLCQPVGNPDKFNRLLF